MQVQLNGRIEEAPDDLTVAQFIADRGLRENRIAVEINERLIPKARFDTTILQPGDHIEVVTFVGGG